MTPLVSIVLTTYNRADALAQTLDTLAGQTLTDYELIICDDRSPDATEKVALDYAARDPRIVYQKNPRNLGMPENLNEGIRTAVGKYVANLHDGDLYDPTLLEKWAAALEKHPRAAFVFNQYRALTDQGETARIYSEDLPESIAGSKLLEDWFFRRWRFDSPVWGTVMARRQAYLSAGLFDQRFSFISDVDMWMRLAETHDVAYVGEPLISLPSRNNLPRAWKISEAELLRTMYREARLRHYRGRPLKMWSEAFRHECFVWADSAYRSLVAAKCSASEA